MVAVYRFLLSAIVFIVGGLEEETYATLLFPTLPYPTVPYLIGEVQRHESQRPSMLYGRAPGAAAQPWASFCRALRAGTPGEPVSQEPTGRLLRRGYSYHVLAVL